MTQKLTVRYTNGGVDEYKVTDEVTVDALRTILGARGRKSAKTKTTQKGPTKRSSAVETVTDFTETSSDTDWVAIEVPGKTSVLLNLTAVGAIELGPVPRRGKK